MTDVFISYSRKDKSFVQRLHQGLLTLKRDVWVDWEDIPLTADWWKEIQGGIEAADAFVFIISPDSIRSDVCRNEIQHAIDHNKRFIPILYREIDEATEMHPAISSHNWVMFQDESGFDTAFKTLIEAMDTDLSYVREHTRLLLRAREWRASERSKNRLLNREDLLKAELWLAEAIGKKPEPTPLHQEYIFASRQHETRRQRGFVARVTAALVVAVVLAVISFLMFLRATAAEQDAKDAEKRAQAAYRESQANLRNALNTQSLLLAAQSADQLENGSPQVALQLALASLEHYNEGIYHPESYFSLVNALRSPVQEMAYLPLERVPWQASWDKENARALIISSDVMATSFSIHGWDTVSSSPTFTIENLTSYPVFTLDGKRLAFWQADNLLRVLDLNGTELNTLAFEGQIHTVQWSQDNTRLLISTETDFSIWNIETDEVQPVTIDIPYTYVEWSADGTRLFLWSESDLHVWDIQQNHEVIAYQVYGRQIAGGELTPVENMAVSTFAPVWSSNSKQVVVIENHIASVLNIETGDWLDLPHEDDVIDAAWSPDNSRILTWTSFNELYVWDLATGENLTNTFTTDDIALAFWFGDGERVVVAAGLEVYLWNTISNEVLTLTHEKTIAWAQINRDGTQILTWDYDEYSPGGTVYIWNSEGHLVYYIPMKAFPVMAFWSDDETALMTMAVDGTVQVWSFQSTDIAPAFYPPGFVVGAAWASDGTGFIVWDETTVRLMDGSGEEISNFWLESFNKSISPDSTRFVSWDENMATLWDMNGQQVNTLEHHSYIYGMAWTEDSARLVAYDETGFYLWNAATGEQLSYLELDTSTGLTWSRDGSRVLTWAEPTVVDVWDLTTGEKIQSLLHDSSIADAVAYRGKILTVTSDGLARIWEEGSETPVQLNTSGEIYTGRLNRDASRVVVWTINGLVQVWRVDGSLLWEKQLDTFAVTYADWSPLDDTLVTAGYEGRVQVWDSDGQMLYAFPHSNTPATLLWSSDGRKLLVTTYEGQIVVWPMDIPGLIEAAKARGGRPLSDEERAQFFLSSVED